MRVLLCLHHMPLHHGQLRAFVQRAGEGEPAASVDELLEAERAAGFDRIETFRDFTERTQRLKGDLRQALARLRADGNRVVGYGAPAKGNTLLGFLQLGPDDNLSLVRPERLEDSLDAVEAIVAGLEGDGIYLNRSPKGEPQLGRRGLYGNLGGSTDGRERERALLWVLSLSDGTHSLLDVAERSGLPFPAVRAAADALLEHDLLSGAT